jgi:hypothetical protein
MSRTDKTSQEMSQSSGRVALTQGVPTALIGAAEQSGMWNVAVARALTEFDRVVAEESGGSDDSSYGVVS